MFVFSFFIFTHSVFLYKVISNIYIYKCKHSNVYIFKCVPISLYIAWIYLDNYLLFYLTVVVDVCLNSDNNILLLFCNRKLKLLFVLKAIHSKGPDGHGYICIFLLP